ncbi:rho GTPase-activating protein 20-like isoform X2 [Watersipora subatra]|uniref:rho GTPase-activating protein 20-like isoform X2 n=1 Tax=Watersipora subatra TaxID=2589382 RepID=UPI00355B08A8
MSRRPGFFFANHGRQLSDGALLGRKRMDEQSTLSRIEKLFPNDDLELSTPEVKKTRRRRSAPSQILLKNFRRSATVVESGSSKLSQDLPTSAECISRRFIFESPVQLTAGMQTQDRYLFLFNDLLFIAKQRSSTSYKLKNRVLVSDIWIGESVAGVSEVGNLEPVKSFVIGWPTTNYIATFTSKELKDRWEDKLKKQINEEQSKEPSTSLDVEIVDASKHVTKITSIRKQADAKELLHQAVESFQIQMGTTADYQLWVLSTKDDSVYPLFGHEQPFAIQLSHDRDAEELDPNIKCQFILRENKKQMKFERKPQKSKKKKLVNIFRKTSNKLPYSPRSNSISEGKIFGHPLDEICDPELPSPVMELLENLYNYGPFTTEIFRKPSNAKRCQEMVAFMNSTDPEGWCKGCHNGILYASILKTFLRELPGKICCSEFYNQWSNAINLSHDEDKIKVLQKIIEKLPKGNQLLLRYIICILSHIAERSDENLMTSYNLAVCLGPSLLWNESAEMSEQEASSKTVPLVVQFLIDQCQLIFGEDILNIFGHSPIAPLDSDTEEVGTVDTIHTRYNDSLESLSDTEAPVLGGLTQMSPSSCSRDSGLILSDPHEDVGEHSDDHSRRQQLIKSKSCDSLRPDNKNHHTILPTLQTQVSSDSLDCDDEYVEVGNSYNYLLTKSNSGVHLYFEKEPERTSSHNTSKISEKLRARLATVANRYAETPISPEVSYSSSDSEKSLSKTPKNEWPSSELLQKSSTSSSLQQGSSSSDDALSTDLVTHRHINSPRILESESGHHPTDFLQQFHGKIESEEAQKKKLRELVRKRTTIVSGNTDTEDEVDSRQTASSLKTSGTHRLHKHNNTGTPKITRTNTYAGRTETRQRLTADVSMGANMAETRPIMPQQYRPNRPPPYREAIERKNKTAPVAEIDRIKQSVNSARAKQLYAKSVQMFEQQEDRSSTSSSRCTTESDSHSSQNTLKNHWTDIANNNTTVGIVETDDKKIVIKRAASTKSTSNKISSDHSSIFYQPGSVGGHITKSTNQLPLSKSANQQTSLFYRPTQPPPYTEALKQRPIKPDLIDSLGGESLV